MSVDDHGRRCFGVKQLFDLLRSAVVRTRRPLRQPGDAIAIGDWAVNGVRAGIVTMQQMHCLVLNYPRGPFA